MRTRPVPDNRKADNPPAHPEACPVCTKQSGNECGRLDCGKREHLTARQPDNLDQSGRVRPVYFR